MKSKSTHAALVKKAHALLRQIVLLRDGKCVCPPPKHGHSPVLQAGHVIRSVKGGSRWSLWNVHLQCRSCNGRHTRDWQVYQEWLIRTFDNDRWLAVLEESKNDGLKSYELEALIEQLEIINALQKGGNEFRPYFTQKEILSGAWRYNMEIVWRKHGDSMEII